MKKTLLALAVAAAATSANAAEIFKSDEATVDFYGQIRTELTFEEGNDHDPRLDAGSSRAGVELNYKATDTLDVFGKVEFSVVDSMSNRLHYVGLSGDFGSVLFGKDWTVGDESSKADYSYFYGGSAMFNNVLTGGSHDSQVKYSYEVDNFFFKAGYGLSEDESNQEAIELNIGTVMDALSFNLAGGMVTDPGKKIKGLEIEQTYLQGTVEYAMDSLTLGASLGTTTLEDTASGDDTTSNGFALAAKYSVSPKTAVYGGFDYVAHDLDALEDSNAFHAGVEHKFSSWARLYAEYAYLDGSTLGFSNDSEVMYEKQSVDKASNFAVGARLYW